MELVVEGVSKTYDDLLVLNQIDLTADEGQIVCIIGERLDERFKLVQESKKIYIVKSL